MWEFQNSVIKTAAALIICALFSAVSAQDIIGIGAEYRLYAGNDFGFAYAANTQESSKPVVNNGDPEKAARFGRMKRIGRINIIGGSAMALTGHVLFGIGIVQGLDFDNDRYGDRLESGATLMVFGSMFMILGYPWAMSGIPLAIVGRVKENQYKPSAQMYIAPNGIKFVMDF